jgi:DNA-binding NtrC family response regulator
MPRRILIVEDDDAIRRVIGTLLSGAGHEVVKAATLQEGRRHLDHESFDLLIADVRLGGFNGLQLLVANPRPLPTIIMTGYPDSLLEAEAKRFGAHYVEKPFSPPALLQLVEETLATASPKPGV